MVRLNTSRPSWSVPNQCAALGPDRMSFPVAVGPTRAIRPGAASSTTTATAAMAITACPPARRAAEGRPGASVLISGVVVAVASAMQNQPLSGQPGARVDRADDQVDDQVDEHVADPDQDDGALHDRDVLAGDGRGQVAAEASPAEDDLGDGRAGQDVAELQADGGDVRDRGVAQR